jgi:alpha-L-fucosidase 2
MPPHGYASLRPARRYQDALIGGNGTIETKTFGDPRNEKVIFRHEGMLEPEFPEGWHHPPEPPNIAGALEKVRELLLSGQYKQANDYAFDAIRASGYPDRIGNNARHEGFVFEIGIEGKTQMTDYLRSVDFRTGESVVSWSDRYGSWERRSIVSRPAGASIQRIKIPKNYSGSVTFSVGKTLEPGFDGTDDYASRRSLYVPTVDFHCSYGKGEITIEAEYTVEAMKGAGYCGLILIDAGDGKSFAGEECLRIEGASDIVLITGLDWRFDYTASVLDELRNHLAELAGRYDDFLDEQRAWQAPIFDRVSLDLASESDRLLTSEELLVEEHLSEGFSPGLVEKVFDMGRYFLLYSHGKTPYIWGHVNINVNLQVASGVQTALPEMMEVYFSWIESLREDWRKNAQNIFGFRGLLSAVHPDGLNGILFHMTPRSPHHYWIAGAGWCYQPFWEYYQTTGDLEFARHRVFPALREIALFFDDYLTLENEKGNYIFAPSYSPENWPGNLDTTQCVVINSVMDISVCREVLEHLLELCEVLGIEDPDMPRWVGILERMPDYLTDDLGALKEWAWPELPERFDHRHLSHLYGVWPGDEIREDINADIARAALLANRKRAQGNASIHGLMHRALTAARLRDSFLAGSNLKQILDQGYLNTGSMMTNHNPYRTYCPDACGSLPVLLIEMIVYSRPGIIELLPALPAGLPQGSLQGIRSRTRAVLETLSWQTGRDGSSGTVHISLRSLIDQSIEVRPPAESALAPMTIELQTEERWEESFSWG